MDIKYPIKIAIRNKGNVVTLEESNYKASGGQGFVCCKGTTAYKIYFNPSHMIPIKKIEELSVLSKLDNVLGPQDIILDHKSGNPIGFTMPYVDKTEFLVRVFNKTFRDDHKITPDIQRGLVRRMQTTISSIHPHKILLVDINEMNYLIDDKFTVPYFIDVDSWQTPSYKATALMDSVRDRQSTPNQFSEGTDWFSFAVVSFQMYMGYHPYQMGRHPVYKQSQWTDRMDHNISCFSKDVTLPAILKDFSTIPPPHLDWYKKVFVDKVRCAPPLPDGLTATGVIQPLLIAGTDRFTIQESQSFKEPILGVYFYNGTTYCVTEKAVYSGHNQIRAFNKKIRKVSLGNCSGNVPVIALKEGDTVLFEDMSGNSIGEIKADDAMQYNGLIYTIRNNRLFENVFDAFGKKIVHSANDIGRVFSQTAKLYPGVVVQDIFGRCRLSIPYSPGKCADIKVIELDGHRIIDAKFDRNICMLISEEKGKYKRSVLCFEKDFGAYTIREDKDILYEPINFSCLSNGVCIHIPDNDKIEVFTDNQKIKTVDDPPFTTEMRLVNDAVSVYFINQSKLYSVKLK